MKELMVDGMHCKSCATLIEDALLEIDGVNEVDVLWEKGIVKVDFDPNKADLDAIKTAIMAEGYKIK